jgi:outer membrane protein W
MIVAVSLLLVAASALAQQPSRSNSVSVFVSDVSFIYSTTNGTRFDAGYGASFAHMFNNRFSGELSVTSERTRAFVTLLDPSGVPTTSTFSRRLYPIDANLSYHFFTDSRWKPYLGAGLRYLSDSRRSVGSFGSREFTTRSLNPEVSGGVTFQFNPTVGLRFDVKDVLGGSGSSLSSDTRASIGLAFRF